MMGATQEKWFEGALANSPAQWNIVANQVMIQQLKEHRNNELMYNMDQWDGYPAARTRLHNFLAARRPSNPVVLTGDTHQTWVGNLKQDFDDPSSPVVGTELVVPPSPQVGMVSQRQRTLKKNSRPILTSFTTMTYVDTSFANSLRRRC